MKLLIDEMWSASLAEQLRQRGHDVVAVDERRDLRSKSDGFILSFARSESRVIVTDNIQDFRRIAATAIQNGEDHAGVIFTTQRRFSRHDPRVIGRMVTALDALLIADPDLTNQEHWLR